MARSPCRSSAPTVRRFRGSRRTSLPALLLALLLGGSALCAQSDETPEKKPIFSDPTALKLVDLHLQARGGRAAIEAIETIHRQANLLEGKTEYTDEWFWKRDIGAREDRRREHLGRRYHRLRASYGDLIWGHDVIPERTKPGKLLPAEETEFAWLSILAVTPFKPFVDGPPFGYVFSYEGTETIRNRPAYVVASQFPDGRVVKYSFDKQNYLLLAIRYKAPFAGQPTMVTAVPTGATRLGGVIFETGYDFYVEGRRFQTLRFTESSANDPIEANFFKKPYVAQYHMGPK